MGKKREVDFTQKLYSPNGATEFEYCTFLEAAGQFCHVVKVKSSKNGAARQVDKNGYDAIGTKIVRNETVKRPEATGDDWKKGVEERLARIEFLLTDYRDAAKRSYFKAAKRLDILEGNNEADKAVALFNGQ